jgi:phage recombination protein Bet
VIDMSNEVAQIEPNQRLSVIDSLARHYTMEKAAFLQVMKMTIMKGANVSNEDIAAFCLVAKEHGLNPFTKEIFAFPANGGIQPIVSVDGWMKLINSHPDFDGMTFDDTVIDGKITAITCNMHRKGRAHPVAVTEYMSECFRQTPTWKQWPARMLRHKTAIQAARYAFGFAGIMEPDEAERMTDAPVQGHVEMVPEARIADERKGRCDAAYEQYGPSVDLIKEQIKAWDDLGNPEDADEMYTVAETWAGIPTSAQMDLWLAPSKGGIFTTHERDTIKTKLPKMDHAA